MTDFLDTLLAQLDAPVPQSGVNPYATGPQASGAIRGPVAQGNMDAINQNLFRQFDAPTAPRVLPGMVGQAMESPAANLASVIGSQPRVTPPVTPTIPTAPTAPAPYAVGQSAAPVAASAAGSSAATVGSGAGTALAGTADDVVAKGLGAKMRSSFPALAGANVSKGALMKGGAAAVAGLMASGWIDSQNFGGENSELDQGLTGGLMGAGVGAGIAMALGGPVGWAALGGAALFAAGNMIWGDNDSAEEKMDKSIGVANQTINDLINNPAFGIDPDTAAQIRLQVAATTSFYKDSGDEAGLNAYLASLAQTVPSFLMESSSRNAAQRQKMELQASFGPIYSRMVDRSSAAAEQALNIQMNAARAISDPQIRSSMEANAANQYSAQMDTMTAYAQQIAAAPQNLAPSAQAVQDQATTMMQQYMGGQ